MCILICGMGNAHPDRSVLATACRNNPDGFGFSILYENGDLVTRRNMSERSIIDSYLKRVERPGAVASIFHARIATSGNINVKNCHPFTVGGDDRSVIAHNGILPINVPKGSEFSDTGIFAKEILPAMGGVANVVQNVHLYDMVEAWAKYNKIAILSARPDVDYPLYIVNEHLGHWNEAKTVWYSNDTACDRVLPAKERFTYFGGKSGALDTKYDVFDSYGDDLDNWTDRRSKSAATLGDQWADVCPTCEGDDFNRQGFCKDCGTCSYCGMVSCTCYNLDDDDEGASQLTASEVLALTVGGDALTDALNDALLGRGDDEVVL